MVCNQANCVAPAGVAILSTPLTDTSQEQRFADVFAPSPNLGGRQRNGAGVRAGATGGTLVIYLSDTASP